MHRDITRIKKKGTFSGLLILEQYVTRTPKRPFKVELLAIYEHPLPSSSPFFMRKIVPGWKRLGI